MASSLRALRPSATALRLGASGLSPIELGQLLRALAPLRRPLLCFRLPADSIGSSAAGVLRAARQRQAAVALLVDFGGVPSRVLAPTLAALGAAADDVRFGLPAAIVALGPPFGFGDAERAADFVSEALDAGFPTPLLSIDGPAEVAMAGDLAAAAAPAREHGLGWALSLGPDPGPDLASLLGELAARDAAPAAVRLAGRSSGGPGDLGGAALWICSDGREAPERREALARAGVALVEAPLSGLAAARGDRAEAFAYFAADAALSAWDAEQTGPRASAALLAAWTE
ncbi:MAG: hypothetical protein ACYDCL_15340 [Myxococcales bacterium]